MGNQPPGMGKGRKKKKKAPKPAGRVGRKRKKGPELVNRIPAIKPSVKCKLRLQRLNLIKDYLVLEEELCI